MLYGVLLENGLIREFRWLHLKWTKDSFMLLEKIGSEMSERLLLINTMLEMLVV